MKPDFEKCVRAIAESLLSALPAAGKTFTSAQLDYAVQVILASHSELPDYLRWPFRTLTVVFDAAPILRRGKPFHGLPLTRRRQIVERWRNSSMANKQDFIRFFETFSTLAYYFSIGDGRYAIPPPAA